MAVSNRRRTETSNLTARWTLLCTFCLGNGSCGQATRSQPPASLDAKFAGQAAWQVDDKLGKKWQEITGRFIFQRACLSCHSRGPASFTNRQWRSALRHFPDEEHVAALPPEFDDLTAEFSYGRMVPDENARYQALRTFVLENAPENVIADASSKSDDEADLLPRVGQQAPSFSIVDTEGRTHALEHYIQNKRALILVFSRAHW